MQKIYIDFDSDSITKIDFEYNNGFSSDRYICYDDNFWVVTYAESQWKKINNIHRVLQKQLNKWVNLSKYIAKFKKYNGFTIQYS